MSARHAWLCSVLGSTNGPQGIGGPLLLLLFLPFLPFLSFSHGPADWAEGRRQRGFRRGRAMVERVQGRARRGQDGRSGRGGDKARRSRAAARWECARSTGALGPRRRMRTEASRVRSRQRPCSACVRVMRERAGQGPRRWPGNTRVLAELGKPSPRRGENRVCARQEGPR